MAPISRVVRNVQSELDVIGEESGSGPRMGDEWSLLIDGTGCEAAWHSVLTKRCESITLPGCAAQRPGIYRGKQGCMRLRRDLSSGLACNTNLRVFLGLLAVDRKSTRL